MIRSLAVIAALAAAAPASAGERIWEDLGYTTSADLAAVAKLVGTATAADEAGTTVITFWETSDRIYRCSDELLPDGVWGTSICQMVRKDME
jgi:hypothetical protein